jgi:hypothetical protein
VAESTAETECRASWKRVIAELRKMSMELEQPAGTIRFAELLERLQPRWSDRAVARLSLFYPFFTLPDDPYPFNRTVGLDLNDDGGKTVAVMRAVGRKELSRDGVGWGESETALAASLHWLCDEVN